MRRWRRKAIYPPSCSKVRSSMARLSAPCARSSLPLLIASKPVRIWRSFSVKAPRAMRESRWMIPNTASSCKSGTLIVERICSRTIECALLKRESIIASLESTAYRIAEIMYASMSDQPQGGEPAPEE